VVLNGNQLRPVTLRTTAGGAARLSLLQTPASLAPTFNLNDQTPWSLQLGRVPPPQVHHCSFGPSDGVPVAGDFNGDGHHELGVYYEGRWFIDYNGNNLWDNDDVMFTFGGRDDIPLVGDWNQDGKSDLGLFSAKARLTAISEGTR